MDPDTLLRRREIRTRLIGRLANLTVQEDISPNSVLSWSASLYSLSLSPYELSMDDVQNVAAIANITLRHALDLSEFSYAAMAGVLQATDAVASLMTYSYNPIVNTDEGRSESVAFRDNIAAGMVPVASAFGDLVAGSMVLGAEPTSLYYNNFRLTVSIDAVSPQTPNVTLSSPLSDFEQLSGKLPTTVKLVSSSESGAPSPAMVTKVVAVNPRSYTAESSAFVSNPLMLQVQPQDAGTSSALPLSSLEFTFQHNQAQMQYAHPESPVNFTSTCGPEDPPDKEFTYVCPGSNVLLSHNCSQGTGVHTSYCPKLASACASLDLTSANVSIAQSCHTVEYNATSK